MSEGKNSLKCRVEFLDADAIIKKRRDDMNAKTIGNNILSLRKKRGITQVELAQKLNISDKTVSKWENGQGYPDIAMLPALASIFGVTIDFLLLGEKKGIVIAGNIIADVVKNIDCFPKCGMMAHVSDVTPAVGGCVSNTAISLMSIDRSLNVSAIGKVGADDNGRYIISQMQKNGVKVDKIKLSEKSQTSFCDVMSLPSGERTFFHKKGANAEFSPKDVDIDALNCSIFHIGYILLLDEFDKEDEEYGTVMAGFLKKVQEKGIKTSIDVVSDSGADYGKKIIPALKYCNYAILNEIEGCRIWNLSAYKDDGEIDRANIKIAMKNMASAGVKDKVVLHSKRISFILDVKSGEFNEIFSLNIPEEEIKGSVGAGDAFCAGCLYGLYNDFSDTAILEFASASAACCLFGADSVSGMKTKDEIMSLVEKYGRLS